MLSLEQYYKECYRIAREHGFWDNSIMESGNEIVDRIATHYVFVTNMIENIRGSENLDYVERPQNSDRDRKIDLKLLLIATEISEALCSDSYVDLAEELADIFIRLMDLIGFLENDAKTPLSSQPKGDIEKFDFLNTLSQKIKKNKKRPHLHNKNC